MKLIGWLVFKQLLFCSSAIKFFRGTHGSANPFASPVRAPNEDLEPARVISEHVDVACEAI